MTNHDWSNRPPPSTKEHIHPSTHPPTPPCDPARSGEAASSARVPLGSPPIADRVAPSAHSDGTKNHRCVHSHVGTHRPSNFSVAHHNTQPLSRDAAKSHFFPTHAARASSDHSRSLLLVVVASPSSRFARAHNKKETYRNYQTPLDRPRGHPLDRPPVCSSGAAARIRSPSAPPGRSRRWMTTPVPVPVPVPPALPVRSTGVNPRNHPPSWTCSVPFRSVPFRALRRVRRPSLHREARASRVGAGGVANRSSTRPLFDCLTV